MSDNNRGGRSSERGLAKVSKRKRKQIARMGGEARARQRSGGNSESGSE